MIPVRRKTFRLGHLTLLATVLASYVAGGAAAQKIEVKTEKDPAADFRKIRTYAWLPAAPMVRHTAPDAVTNPTLSQEALGPHIVAAVDRELTARGLTQAPEDSADVHVVYFAALTQGFNSTYLGEYYGYATGWGSPIPSALAPTTSVSAFEKGTVLIDIVDRASKRAIWRGSMVTKVHQDRTLDQRIKRINEATERIFKKFPIQKGK